MAQPKCIDIDGKIVAQCIKFQDAAGYDTLSIRFTDGSRLMVKEQGQAGYFSVDIAQQEETQVADRIDPYADAVLFATGHLPEDF